MRTKIMRRIGLGIFFGTFMLGTTLYADTFGKIVDENVMMKDAPKIEAVEIKSLEKERIVRIGNPVDEFIEVLDNTDEVAGYVEAKYIVETEPEPVAPVIDKGKEVVEFALKYVGNPYVYGGSSLTNGTDCSGFSSSVYKNFGINIQRSSRSQYASNGISVSKANLEPGDLVFYGYNGSVSHVAIYMGDNKIVHASTPKTGICISPLEQRGGTPYIGAKRVI